jgi:hypothetical protein
MRYAGATQLATGGSISTPSGYYVHTFTGDGTFTTNPATVTTVQIIN